MYSIEQEMKARPQMSEKSTQMTSLSHCSVCHLEFRKKGTRVHGKREFYLSRREAGVDNTQRKQFWSQAVPGP